MRLSPLVVFFISAANALPTPADGDELNLEQTSQLLNVGQAPSRTETGDFESLKFLGKREALPTPDDGSSLNVVPIDQLFDDGSKDLLGRKAPDESAACGLAPTKILEERADPPNSTDVGGVVNWSWNKEDNPDLSEGSADPPAPTATDSSGAVDWSWKKEDNPNLSERNYGEVASGLTAATVPGKRAAPPSPEDLISFEITPLIREEDRDIGKYVDEAVAKGLVEVRVLGSPKNSAPALRPRAPPIKLKIPPVEERAESPASGFMLEILPLKLALPPSVDERSEPDASALRPRGHPIELDIASPVIERQEIPTSVPATSNPSALDPPDFEPVALEPISLEP